MIQIYWCTYILIQGLLPIWTNLLYVDCIRVYVVNKLLEVDKSKQSSWPTYIFAKIMKLGLLGSRCLDKSSIFKC